MKSLTDRTTTASTRSMVQFLATHSALVVAVCVGSALAHIGTSTMPFQIGALIDGTGLTSSQAGLFGFCQVGALAMGMILISPYVDRVQPRLIAISSAVVSAGANLGLFFVNLFPLQLMLGTLSGLGLGFIFAATIAAAAAAEDADRMYAIGNGGALLLITAIMAILPAMAGQIGALGIFIGVAGLCIVCSPLFFGFKQGRRSQEVRIAAWRTPGAAGLLFSWAVFSLGTGGLYAFSERIGRNIQLAGETVGFVLSAGVFIGLIGTATAAYFGGRVHRPRALVTGIVGSGVSCLLLGYASNLTLFIAGVFLYWIAYMFLYSYFLGTAAQLDISGRVGTLGGGLERLGYGAGAWLAGILAEHTSYSSVGALGFAACMIGLAVGYPSLFRALASRKLSDNDAKQPAILAPGP